MWYFGGLSTFLVSTTASLLFLMNGQTLTPYLNLLKNLNRYFLGRYNTHTPIFAAHLASDPTFAERAFAHFGRTGFRSGHPWSACKEKKSRIRWWVSKRRWTYTPLLFLASFFVSTSTSLEIPRFSGGRVGGDETVPSPE